jgi:hypothetical protein
LSNTQPNIPTKNNTIDTPRIAMKYEGFERFAEAFPACTIWIFLDGQK